MIEDKNAAAIDMENMMTVLYGTDRDEIIKASDRELKKLSKVKPVNAEHEFFQTRMKLSLYLCQLPQSKADKALKLLSDYEQLLINQERQQP